MNLIPERRKKTVYAQGFFLCNPKNFSKVNKDVLYGKNISRNNAKE